MHFLARPAFEDFRVAFQPPRATLEPRGSPVGPWDLRLWETYALISEVSKACEKKLQNT